jgi:tetratricopeptide (TPR) repeat protein
VSRCGGVGVWGARRSGRRCWSGWRGSWGNRTPGNRGGRDLWLARAYLNERRHDDCITLLTHARFSNWEGQTTPHDLFVAALTARGRTAFNAGDFASARADFERALTYPENLEVGARYELTDAELRHWLGRTWLALGQREKARQAWLIGARQRTSQDPPRPFIHITPAQDDHVRKCREALWQLADGT